LIDRQYHITIIFNAPESDGNNKENTSLIKSVKHVITFIVVPKVVSKLVRKSNNLRPLNVTIHDTFDVFIVLENKHKNRTSPIHGSMRLSSDRTIVLHNKLGDIEGNKSK
jgi:hypothetical protein